MAMTIEVVTQQHSLRFRPEGEHWVSSRDFVFYIIDGPDRERVVISGGDIKFKNLPGGDVISRIVEDKLKSMDFYGEPVPKDVIKKTSKRLVAGGKKSLLQRIASVFGKKK